MTRLLVKRAVFASVLVLSCGATSAQGRHLFDVDSTQSSVTFSGNVTALGISGTLVGMPATVAISGAAEADLTVSGGILTNGQLVRGSSSVSLPPLQGSVQSAFGSVATVAVTSMQAVFTTVDPSTLAPAPFAVGSGGSFTAWVIADVLSGTATFTTFLGGQEVVPLAGQQSTPQMISGTIVSTPSGFRLNVPVQSTFPFSDPGSGASGTLTINGTLIADDRALATDVSSISMTTGGLQTMTLSAGTASAGETYLVMGSISGTQPGVTLRGVSVPLNFDSYLIWTATSPNVPPLGSTLGVLDPLGVGTATFGLPPLPALAGLQFNHAYVVISTAGLTLLAASNPVPLTLDP